VKSQHARQRFVGRVDDDGRIRDPFAEEAEPLTMELPADPGDFVAVEVEGPKARTVRRVARASTALASIWEIAARHGLDPVFPPEVEEEARRLEEQPGLDDPALVDLTHLPFCTIDDAGARDLDQALHLERDGDGHLVRYALADAAYYVRPGSRLHDEALRRGSSYYLPGLVVPMLPRRLSEGVISLNEEVERRSMVFEMQLDAGARCVQTRLVRARIRSRAKLSFEQVQDFIDGRPTPGIEGELAASLALLRPVGEARIRLAEARGVVRFRRVRVKTDLSGEQGRRFHALSELRNDVERYNEQLSLLCNVQGARFLQAARPSDGVQAIYRVHPPPTEERYAQLERLLTVLSAARDLDPAVWTWRRAKASLADFLRRLPVDAPATIGAARAVHRHAILLNLRSTFAEEPAGHFGVGASVYARFSAPMREMVGVFCHKEAWEQATGTGRPDDPADEELRDRVVEVANRARQVQRSVEKAADRLVLDQLLTDDLDRPAEDRAAHPGTLVGLSPSRAYVLLEEPPIDAKVYFRDLERLLGHRLRVDEAGVRLFDPDGDRTIALLGDGVTLRVVGRDAARDRWQLELG
jgi:ribonuclease R